jgi:hypothetical protein
MRQAVLLAYARKGYPVVHDENGVELGRNFRFGVAP